MNTIYSFSQIFNYRGRLLIKIDLVLHSSVHNTIYNLIYFLTLLKKEKERKGCDVWPSMVSHTWNLCSAFNPSK